MPVAVNCWVTPAGILCILGVGGVIEIEDKVAEFTVRLVLPEILPEVAVMAALPAATAVARPLMFTVATNISEELQATCAVMA